METMDSAPARHELRRPAPYRISVPESLAADGLDYALSFEPNDGRPRLVCRPANTAGGHAVTRTVSRQSGESTPGLTLPKQCIETAGLVGSHTLVHESGDGRLCVGFDRSSRLDGVALAATDRTFVSRRRGGELALSVTDDIAGPLRAANSLWFSVDHYGGQLFFVFDGAESVSPPWAIELTTNPNTGRGEIAGLSVLFPRVVGRLCGVGSTTLRIGRTESDNRLLATTAGD